VRIDACPAFLSDSYQWLTGRFLEHIGNSFSSPLEFLRVFSFFDFFKRSFRAGSFVLLAHVAGFPPSRCKFPNLEKSIFFDLTFLLRAALPFQNR